MNKITAFLNKIYIVMVITILCSRVIILEEPLFLLVLCLYIYNNRDYYFLFIITLVVIYPFFLFIKMLFFLNLLVFLFRIVALTKYHNINPLVIYNIAIFCYLLTINLIENVDFILNDSLNIIFIVIILNIIHYIVIIFKKEYKIAFSLALDKIFR